MRFKVVGDRGIGYWVVDSETNRRYGRKRSVLPYKTHGGAVNRARELQMIHERRTISQKTVNNYNYFPDDLFEF